MAGKMPPGGSEYGGYPGLIQPEPHKWEESASEQLSLAFKTDSTEVESSPGSVAEELRKEAEGRPGWRNK